MPDISFEQKSLLATVILVLAVLQLLSVSVGRGWLAHPAPGTRRALIMTHRLGGYIGMILIMLVAYYCVFVLDTPPRGARAGIHALLGALCVGLVWAKMAVARVFTRHYRLLPWLGAALGSVTAGVWASSALWYYINF